jgi:prepilin-type N-terminal cleavage/methylation domain-containing protein
MVLQPTCPPRRKSRRGFTLAEYLIATSIGLLALAAALVLWAFATRTCATLLGYVELSNASKNTLDRMSQQIRNAKSVVSCSSNQLVILVPAGTNLDSVMFDYDSPGKTLKQTTVRKNPPGREVTTLLTGCSSFQFSVYQRTPIPKTFALNTDWKTNTAKVVQMQWTCFRQLTGDKNTVDSQVSSKVVIRNQ